MHPDCTTPVRIPRGRLPLVSLTALALLGACEAIPNATVAPDREALEAVVPVRNFDVRHYAIDLVLHPERQSIEASCRVEFEPLGAGVDTIELDLEGLEVRSVRDAGGQQLAHRQEGDKLLVLFGAPLPAGSTTQVTVVYGGRPVDGMWFSGVGADGDSPSQVFTHGQADHNSGWFPCLDHPSDRATSELRVTMPADWVGVLPGERVSVREEGATRTEHWRMEVEHPAYLVSLVAGEFLVERASWEGVPLTFAVEPQYRDWVEASFGDTGEILAFLSRLTGLRYPYSKYSQVCVANFPGRGMENVSAATLSTLTLGDARQHRDEDSTGLLVHEAAQQWFGNLLTCADWPHIWLHEAFATYCQLLYVEETQGLDAMRTLLRDAQDRYVAEDTGARRRPTVWDAYDEAEDLMDTRAAEGGAGRLHLLRFLLGDEAFFEGIRRYVADNAGRSVVTSDLKRAFEQASGRDLTRFFEQWIYARGYPEFDLDWSFDANAEEVVFEVRQTQSSGGGTPSAFLLPVDVEVRDEGGTVVHRVELTGRQDTFRFPVAGEPLYVRFDHGGWIPKTVTWRDRSVAELLVIAHEDTDVNGRRDALEALGELGAFALSRSRTDTLETIVAELSYALRRDESEACRIAAARALGEAGVVEGRERLILAAAQDPSARVRTATLTALTKFDPIPEMAQVAEKAFDEGYSWRTMAAAAELYAHAAPLDAYSWLTQKLFIDSPHDVLRRELLEDLGGLENGGVIGQLRRWANDVTTHPSARAAALRQLSLQSSERPENSRFLAGFLESDSFRLRGAAVECLTRMGDEDARRALRAYYPLSQVAQERRLIEATLSRPDL